MHVCQGAVRTPELVELAGWEVGQGSCQPARLLRCLTRRLLPPRLRRLADLLLHRPASWAAARCPRLPGCSGRSHSSGCWPARPRRRRLLVLAG